MSGGDAFLGTERFVLGRRLGSGAFGTVYQAHDRNYDIPVALKVLHQVDSQALLEFKQEFRLLAELHHQNLITLYELGCVDHWWFYSMELIDGVDLIQYVSGVGRAPARTITIETPGPARASTGPKQPGATAERAFDEARLRHALAQLAEGVRVLHQAGLLHRDLKPSNVLVDRHGRVVLVDFGIARHLAPPSWKRNTNLARQAGTPGYMAPERWHGGTESDASDCYAIGAMLYEALTGALPEPGARPSAAGRSVPPDLDDLCAALLSSDPARRPSAAEVGRRLQPASRTAVAEVVGPRGGEPGIVGRHRELAQLLDAYRCSAGGCTVLVEVVGPSGIGKSALIRELLNRLHRQGATLLVGRCHQYESIPFNAFRRARRFALPPPQVAPRRLARRPPGRADALADAELPGAR